MAATAGSVSVSSTTGVLIWEDQRGATGVSFHSTGSGISIHVPGLHADGDWMPMHSNEHHTFRMQHSGLKQIYAKVASGSHTLEFGTVEKSTADH